MNYVLLLVSSRADGNAMAHTHYSVVTAGCKCMAMDPAAMVHSYSNSENVNLMIQQGARMKFECPDQSKPSMLNLAILKGDLVMMQMLLAGGANVNSSSSVIGSPLHVACSANIPNRKEILQILLKSGADPNLKVYNDKDGTQIPTALVDYLGSNPDPSAEIVAMLLRYGAKVIMKTRCRDPDGILNHLKNVTSEEYQHIFYLLLEAAEAFDLCVIQMNNVITATQKEALIDRAKTPISLLAQSRICLRRYFKTTLVDVVQDMELPKILHQYLLFDSL